MKRIGLISCLIFTISSIICLIVLLVLSLMHYNKYDSKDSMVFIESIGNNSIKEGMGFVYKIENDYNYIVTNYHVVESSNYLYVYNLENKKESASIVYYDIYTDIAILQIDNELGFKKVKITRNLPNINEAVYYFNINNNLMEKGTILNLDNEINLSTDYGNSFYKAISIKGNIINGNSGGPLFNSKDEVIGLISLKEDDSKIGFYIPISDVMDVVTKLENHTLVRPNLGATFANTTNIDLLNEYGISANLSGVVVLDVVENYPLYTYGLIKGDVITKVDDVIIENVFDLQKQIYSHSIGDTTTLEYYRNDILNKVDIVLDK